MGLTERHYFEDDPEALRQYDLDDAASEFFYSPDVHSDSDLGNGLSEMYTVLQNLFLFTENKTKMSKEVRSMVGFIMDYSKLVEQFENAIKDWVSKRGKPMEEEPESYHIYGWEVDFSTIPGDKVLYTCEFEPVKQVWFYIPSYEEYYDEDYFFFANKMADLIFQYEKKENGCDEFVHNP